VRKVFLALTVLVLVFAAGTARAETKTLSWNAVTTYTDGTPIAGTVTYTMFWSASASLTSPHYLANDITGLSVTFDINTEGMARGTTVYFSGTAKVASSTSANAPAYAWVTPYKVPNAPGNLRITLILNQDGTIDIRTEEIDRV